MRSTEATISEGEGDNTWMFRKHYKGSQSVNSPSLLLRERTIILWQFLCYCDEFSGFLDHVADQ